MISDSFRSYSARVKPMIEESLQQHLSTIFCTPPGNIRFSIFDELRAGKKLRGCLTCLVAESLGADLSAALPRAAAIELIQAATLIHDDFIDQDTLRRNRPAVWTVEGPRRAVLIGDVIFASAIAMMNNIGREDGLIISNAIAEISRGALNEPIDPSHVEGGFKSDQWFGVYEEIIRLKTGILFASASQLGALAADRETEIQAHFYRFGLALGEAYQIADDLKEIRECSLTGVNSGRHFVNIAPAVFRFVPESSETLRGFFKTGGDRAIEDLLSLSTIRMMHEIEERLKKAMNEIDCNGAIDNLCIEQMQTASREIIEMFNES